MIRYEENVAYFEDLVNESEIGELKEFLKSNSPNIITFDFTNCRDIHTVILQLIGAYKVHNGAIFQFSQDKVRAYQKFLEGFVGV